MVSYDCYKNLAYIPIMKKIIHLLLLSHIFFIEKIFFYKMELSIEKCF
ncbi:hypothetical protein NIES267_15490 [Calothrix parasitica NIES-267]|uniref:Uncharacterized protein n=1 Tax=Calothrix parasitica NIES-267 TaxID=1973488 RepID=A0A1Z4LLF2_9CYAN|nr:hypothetical protein NIES267_15490 [Calothrix parasitica NIES-267]